MKLAKQPVVLALGVALALAGCGSHNALPTSATSVSAGKYHAKALSPGKHSIFSKRHLVVRMAAGAKSPLAGVKVRTTITDRQIHDLPPNVTYAQALAAYQKAPGVTSIEPLELFPVENGEPPAPVTEIPVIKAAAPLLATNDPLYFQQYAHQLCHVQRAWEITRGRPEVIVAALDTGVDFHHPDLQGQVIDGPDFGENKNTSLDIDEHGTHVAGIVAAIANNGIGGAGVAPGCKVLAVKIFEPYFEDGKYQGTFYNAFSLARAIQYSVTQGGAKIINISAGIADDELVSTMFAFARGKGTLICVSAGNNGNNVYTGEPKNMDGILVTHATTAADQLARFSNYGSTMAISAPGEAIWSTVPTYANPNSGAPASRTGYESLSGTSMASPFVAGVAALVVSGLMDQMEARLANTYNHEIQLTPADVPGTVVEDLIRSSCKDLGRPGRDEIYGCGRVDAGRALELCADGNWVDRAVKEYLRNGRR